MDDSLTAEQKRARQIFAGELAETRPYSRAEFEDLVANGDIPPPGTTTPHDEHDGTPYEQENWRGTRYVHACGPCAPSGCEVARKLIRTVQLLLSGRELT